MMACCRQATPSASTVATTAVRRAALASPRPSALPTRVLVAPERPYGIMKSTATQLKRIALAAVVTSGSPGKLPATITATSNAIHSNIIIAAPGAATRMYSPHPFQARQVHPGHTRGSPRRHTYAANIAKSSALLTPAPQSAPTARPPNTHTHPSAMGTCSAAAAAETHSWGFTTSCACRWRLRHSVRPTNSTNRNSDARSRSVALASAASGSMACRRGDKPSAHATAMNRESTSETAIARCRYTPSAAWLPAPHA
mmetsp:Transcript_14966/g.62291  ORF Transcript_14966/g.62291 Transcript_14966/m.62291 type:complete len:256 (-) Transcript_14966:355-1122(-)